MDEKGKPVLAVVECRTCLARYRSDPARLGPRTKCPQCGDLGAIYPKMERMVPQDPEPAPPEPDRHMDPGEETPPFVPTSPSPHEPGLNREEEQGAATPFEEYRARKITLSANIILIIGVSLGIAACVSGLGMFLSGLLDDKKFSVTLGMASAVSGIAGILLSMALSCLVDYAASWRWMWERRGRNGG